MKTINKIKFYPYIFLSLFLFACTELDREPLSSISPEVYFSTEAQLQDYVNELYIPGQVATFPVHSSSNMDFGTFGTDNNTDNMNAKSYSTSYLPGEWKVGQTGGEWYFGYIYKFNYFFKHAGAKLENGEISGNKENIDQYFGEVHVLRAWEYFKKLQTLGDFPIVTEPLENDMDVLIEASKRQPRTEVVRFILSDLNKAIELLKDRPGDGRKTRISKDVAYMIKSRVALFEATWMKYFKGTAFVPNGTDWPGATKDYNKGYTISNYDALTDSLFQVSMDASKRIAERYALTENNGILQQNEIDAANPYLNMFATPDLSGYSEVIFWREYSRGLGVSHNVPIFAQTGGQAIGLTRGYVDNFLLDNGLPIYADPQRYQGDNYIANVRKNRDNRLFLFLKEPDQKNVLFNTEGMDRANPIEGYPDITGSNRETGYGTGYSIRKGGTFDGAQFTKIYGCYTGSIVFRSAEAMLNYMEACYEKNASLDGTAKNYWRQIRERAKVNPNYEETIAATNMQKEAANDWGAYSAGNLIDPTLYNIRRERRSELMAEGLRMFDLKRWRALDQMITTPYHIEGFKLWGPMQNWYKDSEGNSTLKYGGNDNNVSSQKQSEYLRPQEINPLSLIYIQGGCKWAMAHYLYPISIGHFLITGKDGAVADSPIYQNPYWPLESNSGALK